MTPSATTSAATSATTHLQGIQRGTHAFFAQGSEVVIRPLNASSWTFKLAAALNRLGLSDDWNLLKSHLPVADPAQIRKGIVALLAAREARADSAGQRPEGFKTLQERVISRHLTGGSTVVSVRLARSQEALQRALNLERNAQKVIDRVSEAIDASGEKIATIRQGWELTPENLQARLSQALGERGEKAIDELASRPAEQSDVLAADIARAWITDCNTRLFTQQADKAFFNAASDAGAPPFIDRQALCTAYRQELAQVPLRETALHTAPQCLDHAQRLLVQARAHHLLHTLGNPVPDFFADPARHPDLAHLPDDGTRTDAVARLLTSPVPTQAEGQAIGVRMVDNAMRDAFLASARTDGASAPSGVPASIGQMSTAHRDEARDLLVRMQDARITDRASSQSAWARTQALAEAHLPAPPAGLELIDGLALPPNRREALVEVLYDDVTNRNQADPDARIGALTQRLRAAGSAGEATGLTSQPAVSTQASDLYAEVAFGQARQQLFGAGADSAREQAIAAMAALGYDAQLLQTLASALDARLQQRFDRDIDGSNADALRASILRDYQQQLQDMAMTLQVPGLNGAMVIAELQPRLNAVRIACKGIATAHPPTAAQLREARTILQALHDGTRKATIGADLGENLRNLLMAQMGRQFAGQPERLQEELITMSQALVTLSARENARTRILGRGGPDPAQVATLNALSEGARAMLAQVSARD